MRSQTDLKKFYDKDGEQIDLSIVYGVYKTRERLIGFFRRCTNYLPEEIETIVNYIMDNVDPAPYNHQNALRMMKQIEGRIPDEIVSPESMRTAEEMYQYCLDNGLGEGQTRNWALKHFSIIEHALAPDENVLICFIGLHNYVSMTKHDKNFAYAITNKRILMAQKKLIGEVLQTVSISQLNDITFKSGLALGILTIDTVKECFNVSLNKDSAKNISDRIHTILLNLKQNKIQTSPMPASHVDTEQLLKLKELLDAGILTQEEFDRKKKQILGL